MNIQTDAWIGNQCGHVSAEKTRLGPHSIVWLNSDRRGVGYNRNLVLEHAAADICILADDDMRFVDGYPEIARKAFAECSEADVWIFNLIEKKPRRWRNEWICRIGRFNYARYGAARLAVRRQSLADAGIAFHTMFGGGTRYSAGEDTIFLKECLDRGLKLYAVPYALAEIDQDAASTWFTGYHEKFFSDKGALYAQLYPHLWAVYAARYILVYQRKFKGSISLFKAFKSMLQGGAAYRREMEG